MVLSCLGPPHGIDLCAIAQMLEDIQFERGGCDADAGICGAVSASEVGLGLTLLLEA